MSASLPSSNVSDSSELSTSPAPAPASAAGGSTGSLATSRWRRVAAALTVAGVAVGVVGTAAPAGAATTGRPLARVKAECSAKIDTRVTALQNVESRISSAKHLTDDQKQPVIADIESTINLLNTQYRTNLAAAKTRAAVKAACSSVFVDLRIFAVYIPQVANLSRLDALWNYDATVTAQVDAAESAGTDVSALRTQLASAEALLHDAEAKIATVTVASYNADPVAARATWDAVTSNLQQAFGQLLQVDAAV